MSSAQRETGPPSELPMSAHLITLPFPSAVQATTQLVAHLTLFQGPSVLLWCGGCEEGSTATVDGGEQARSQAQSSLLIEQHHAAPSASKVPTGRLTDGWAVAMTSTQNKTTSSTSLYQSSSDLSKSMASRLSKRFSLAQLFLSLSLPSHILSALEGPHGGNEGSQALLMIEGALGDILKQTL